MKAQTEGKSGGRSRKKSASSSTKPRSINVHVVDLREEIEQCCTELRSVLATASENYVALCRNPSVSIQDLTRAFCLRLGMRRIERRWSSLSNQNSPQCLEHGLLVAKVTPSPS